MKENEEVVASFKAMLRIIETTLSGKEVPFKIVDFVVDENIGVYAIFDLDGESFYITPDTVGSRVWISGFPIENTGTSGLDSGYAGFPTEVAGVIDQYYREKPKGPFKQVDSLGDLGNFSLNEIIREEVRKIFEAGYDYAGQEVEYTDKEYYRQDMEAEVSTASSFMQDIQNSINSIRIQKDLKATSPEVDRHLDEAKKHLNEAIVSYLDALDPDVKAAVIDRLGEINI